MRTENITKTEISSFARTAQRNAYKYIDYERKEMAKTKEITGEQRELIDNYLSSYRFCRRLMAMKNYEEKYFDTMEWESESPAEFTVARAKMYEVRHFILAMKNGNEKLLLYYHYVRGDSVEKCAELMGFSRSSAFRLKKRALAAAYYHSIDMNKELKRGMF